MEIKATLTPNNINLTSRVNQTPSESGGSSNYNELENKPKINNVTLIGNKSASELHISYSDLDDTPTIPSPYDDTEIVERVENIEESVENKVTKIDGKGLSTNDYTTAEKTKLASLSNYATIEYVDEIVGTIVDELQGI